MFGLGTGEIIAIVLVIFLLFGATRLPQLARSLGQSRKAFKDALRDADSEEKPTDGPQTASKLSDGSIDAMSDEAIMAEIRRRAETPQK